MTLNEAIIHAENVVRLNDREADRCFRHGGSVYAEKAKNCKACADEHRQLAEWLRELKAYKEQDGDTIDRQAAIDALERKKDKNAKGDIGGFYNKIIQNDIDTLMQLPSAQPEKRTEKRTETHARDCISRQAAIRIASGYCHPANIAKELERLPSAQQRTKTGHWIMPRNCEGIHKDCTDCILDKIRAEIMSKDGLEEALEIIDKYRAESEVGE